MHALRNIFKINGAKRLQFLRPHIFPPLNIKIRQNTPSSSCVLPVTVKKMDPMGFEPTVSALRTQRFPS